MSKASLTHDDDFDGGFVLSELVLQLDLVHAAVAALYVRHNQLGQVLLVGDLGVRPQRLAVLLPHNNGLGGAGDGDRKVQGISRPQSDLVVGAEKAERSQVELRRR